MFNLTSSAIKCSGRKLLRYQLVMIILLGLGFGIFGGISLAYSIGAGGLVAFLTNWYFIRRFFKFQSPKDVMKTLSSIYFGEFVKLLILGVLFVTAIILLHVKPFAFLIGYFIVNSMNWWAAPWCFLKRK